MQPSICFQIECPTCGAPVRTSPEVFEGVDFRHRSGAPWEASIDREIPCVEGLRATASGVRGPHPLRESVLPAIDIGCPRCDAPITVALALFAVDADWKRDAQVHDSLVGQRSLELVSGYARDRDDDEVSTAQELQREEDPTPAVNVVPFPGRTAGRGDG